MSARARPFLFDTDFRSAGAQAAAHEAQARADLAEQAHARGLEEGFARADLGVQARLADALVRLAHAAAGLLAQADAADAARDEQALVFACALARRIAGDALEASPLAAVEEAARAALVHLRGVPHLVVRVHESLVEDAQAALVRLARERGYEGRLVVLGEPDMAPGDARIEWADGGVVRERARIEAAALAAVGLSD